MNKKGLISIVYGIIIVIIIFLIILFFMTYGKGLADQALLKISKGG